MNTVDVICESRDFAFYVDFVSSMIEYITSFYICRNAKL